MSTIRKYERIFCKYHNLQEFQIPAFRAFCKTVVQYNYHMIVVDPDPDPVVSASFGRIRIRIVTEKTDPERIRVA